MFLTKNTKWSVQHFKSEVDSFLAIVFSEFKHYFITQPSTLKKAAGVVLNLNHCYAQNYPCKSTHLGFQRPLARLVCN